MKIEIPDTLDTLEGVDPKYRALYEKSDDGRYVYSDPSKLANAYRATKEKAQRDAEEATRLRQEFEARKDIDPLKYQDLVAREAEIEEARRAASGEFDRVKNELKASHDAQLSQARKDAETWRTRYAMDKLESDVEFKLRAKGATDAGIKLLKDQIVKQATLEYEGDKPSYKFMDGQRIKLNAEADPYTIDDFAEEFRKEYPGLFSSGGLSGMGAGQPSAADPGDLSDIGNILNWPMARKNAYAKKYGDDAYKKAVAQAGAAKAAERLTKR